MTSEKENKAFKRNKHYEAGTLLFGYFDGRAELPTELGHTEITLTATEDSNKLQMDVYTRPDGDGEVETKTTYIVPAAALADAMKLVKKYKLADWDKHDYPFMCGRKMVCKFIHNGELVRVSSENMP